MMNEGHTPAELELTTASVEIGSGRLVYSRSPVADGPPVIAIHGVPGSRSDLNCLLPAGANQLDLICPDMPGFGDSEIGGVGSHRGWAEAIEELADQLGLERFSLLGHSMGGGAALLLTQRLPQRVDRLLFLCSIGVSPHSVFRQTPPAGFGALVEQVTEPSSRSEVVAMVRGLYDSLGLEAPVDWRQVRRQLEVCATTDFDALRRAAEAVEVPATIIHSVDDPYIEVELARELARTLPDATLHELPRGGHYPQRTSPEAVLALLGPAVR